jgi:TRAP-type C4-dicarboxylate transport system substrate-binding protein
MKRNRGKWPQRRTAVVGGALATGLALAGCGGGASSETAEGEIEELDLRINSSLGETHILSLGGKEFAEQLEEQSDGKISTTFSDSGALVAGPDEITALSSKTIDVGSIVSSYHTGVIDYLAATFTLPYVGNMDTLQEITRLTWEDAQADVEDEGIRLLFSVPIRTEFFFSEEVPCGEPDFSGMRVRAHGGYANDVVEIFGGSPQFMPSSEIPSAIGTGVIDAFSTSLQSWNASLTEQAPFVCNSDGEYNGPVYYGINQGLWDGLNDATQELITEVALEAEDFAWQAAKEEDDQILSEAEENPDITVVTQTTEEQEAVRERLAPIYEAFRNDFGDAAERYFEAAEEVDAAQVK